MCIYIYSVYTYIIYEYIIYICKYMTTYTYHTFVYTYCMCMYLPMIYSKTQRYFSPWSAPFPTILTLQLRSQFCGSAPASMMEATWFPSYLMLSNGDFFVDQGLQISVQNFVQKYALDTLRWCNRCSFNKGTFLCMDPSLMYFQGHTTRRELLLTS